MKTTSPAVGVAPGPLLRFAPVAALVVSLVVLLALWRQVLELHEEAARQSFELETRRVTTKIQQRVDAYEQILHGAAGLLAASPEVSRSAWRAYVAQLALDQGYQGIQGVSFVVHLTAAELPAHVRAVRAEGFPSYVVTPEGERPEYSSIVYLEPFEGRNLRAFGYDMLTDPTRRAAMERARDTGEVVPTGKVRLMQETETDPQAGVVVFQAVYRARGVLQTVEQRRAALLGWVSTPFRMNDLLDGMLEGELDGMRVQVFDGDTTEPSSQLYDSAGAHTPSSPTSALALTTTMTVHHHAWTLRYESPSAFVAGARHVQPWVELTGISLIVALAFGLSLALVHTRRRAHALASALTAAKELEEKSQHYERLMEGSRDAVHVVDREGRVREWNRAFLSHLGYTADEARSLRLSDFVAGRTEEEARRRIAALFEKPGRFEARHRRKDGTLREVEIDAAPIEVAGETMLYASARDVTDRKRLEEEVTKAQKLEAIGVLAGGIAHDFNNLLAAILGHVELAMGAAGPGTTIASDLEVAKSSIGRATELTKRLLTFARGGAPVKRRLGAARLLSDSLALALGGSATRSELRIDEALWEVEADEGQLGQVLSNVLLNARQAMDGTGSISIFARNRTVAPGELVELPPGDYVQIDVQDDGPGIPEHLLPKVFDPFFTTKTRSSGLGLTTAYSIVRRHGGRMWIESPPGSGAIVRMLLPAVLRASSSTPRPLAPPPALTDPRPIPRQRQGRVLVMDDEPAVLGSVAATLRSLGLEVDTAPEGSQALLLFDQAVAERRPYQLVILDLTVVGGLGGEATNRLLRERDPAVVTVVSSGYSDSPILAGAEQHGFAGTLAKPYSRDDLIAVVDRLLESAPASRGGLKVVR